MNVLLAGGGTAGHVAPLLATADALRRRDPSTRLLVLGTAEGLEARLVPERGYRLAEVPRVPLPRRPSADLLRLPGRLRGAVAAAHRALEEVGADVVVGFGGYVATPAYLAARRAGVPVVVHEQNSLPGIANRLGARWARHVAVTFPGTPLRGAMHTGMPLRTEVTDLARAGDRAGLRRAARARLGLDPDAPTLLVTGGSLGAQRLNDVLGSTAADLLAAGAQVLHASGRGKQVALAPGADPARYVVRPYLDDMGTAYAAADLVVCRSGAGTVSELTALGLPGVYVPLPIGNGEQRRNAEAVVAAGGGLLVPDAELDAAFVRGRVLPLLTDPAALAAAAAAAAAFGVLDGDERLAVLVADAAGGAA
ncbi:undecaprenyldiphospho-muramoylpentapeptide beta-N-acetylglucosaminyltransferase [Kineococcus indalonis]|uniref:undecaprenyldiphospho-muramoylpentapeptide beta-N-acetylglucosaminyltransferase n=1 Tax=Kineococcus indalonis TaxID=2696566 RepID=UPI001412B83C|nr:undecaprenyldiphospho-muramoylpentapeptide beta-N-acetylglucosaminyltransferase [Kineococcus indalonis]NAZ85894.1 undecaprenyldiphospho-muramoylpentapeptide beta-N-acetylglucosaminyltransferase [Kineococcus indalonis]